MKQKEVKPRWTCEKHDIGEPSCRKCWAALFRAANQLNIGVVGTHEDIGKSNLE